MDFINLNLDIIIFIVEILGALFIAYLFEKNLYD